MLNNKQNADYIIFVKEIYISLTNNESKFKIRVMHIIRGD